ncbi:MAG TPA: anthranilate phosphoribosyltransferase [Chloroflexota bacterium]|nr:anthranilate phosphoribosyltransferase [Chloroflexota bacterium]
MSAREAIAALVDGRDLSEEQARAVMTAIMEEQVTPAQFGALVTALRLKGETIDEIAGFAGVMRDKAVPVRADGIGMVVDTCGTGGDGRGTFNVSTAAAIVTAAVGPAVAKHGNRAASSHCGSADVLDALGVAINLGPDAVTACLERAGIAFMLAPLYHPATKFAVGPRREIGIRTVFNILGPLTNPARVKAQVMGVPDARLVGMVARVLQRLGSRHVFVVHAEDGTDEISISGPTYVAELHQGEVREYSVTPEELGVERAPLDEVKGGDAATNAAIITALLQGDGPRAARDIVALNAGAALVAAEVASDLPAGVAMARDTIDKGLAWRKLEQWRAISNRLAAEVEAAVP